MSITARMWAGAREAAGCDEVTFSRSSMTLTELTREIADQAPDPARAGAVLAACSILLGDQPVSSQDPDQVAVASGQTVEFLPPFAGG